MTVINGYFGEDTVRLCRYPVSPNNLTTLGIISGSCLQSLLLWCSNADLFFPSFLLFINWDSSVRKLSYLFIYCLFNQSFIAVWSHGCLFYSLGFFCYFSCSSIGRWEVFQVHLCVLLMSAFCLFACLSTTSLSGMTLCSRLSLYFLCTSPSNSHCSEGPWFFYRRVGL